MTQEEKDLLLKDLSARLPYDVKVQYYDNGTKKFEVGTIISCTIPIDETYQKYPTFITSRDLLIIQGNIIEDIKPYLFPMSSMTEEQKMEIKSLCDGTEIFDDGGWMSYISIVGNFNFELNLSVVDWLNKNHFDYRGLIERGLALDATGLNIY